MAEDARKPREDRATPTAVAVTAEAEETKPRLESGGVVDWLIDDGVIGWVIIGETAGASVATELTCSRLFMAGPQNGWLAKWDDRPNGRFNRGN